VKKILPILLFVFFQTLSAQTNSLIQNINGRKTTSLNGEWQIIIDPYENGYYNYRYEPDINGYFNNAKPKNKTERIEYDFDKSETLTVPGDWNSQKEKLFLYEGTVWYKKSFNYQKNKDSRVFVYFGAVNYQCRVYLNGKEIGRHTGGFTSFNFDITDKIQSGENFIIVKADNKRLREGVPTLNTDWWNYGGITRDVNIVETPNAFINDYLIQLDKKIPNKISGWARFNKAGEDQKVLLKIPELNIGSSFVSDKNGVAHLEFFAMPILWSPVNPKLYDVIICTESDTIKDKIGFRNISVGKEDILLNGKKIFLKGISIHEEAPVRNGRANTTEDAEMLLSWAKELGCNFVRLAHYPHNENMIRAADKMGLMVWSEIPVYWTILWDNAETYKNASTQLTEMISRDKNRASIVLWSVANETPRSDKRLQFLKNLISQAREIDPTRLITAANEIHYIDSKTIILDDPLGEFLDVLGCNEYIGWYDGLPAKADTINWKSLYNKPLIMSELGGGAKFGYHADSLTIWSEEFQESIYKHQTKMLKNISFLKGISPWILMDFRSPRRHLPGIQDFFNRKGLLSNKGERKKAFYILKKFYESMSD